MLQRLRHFLEANGGKIYIPDNRTFESEGAPIEQGVHRAIERRDEAIRSLLRSVYRFRDAVLVDGKNTDFGGALQDLYREPTHAEKLVGPPGP